MYNFRGYMDLCFMIQDFSGVKMKIDYISTKNIVIKEELTMIIQFFLTPLMSMRVKVDKKMRI